MEIAMVVGVLGTKEILDIVGTMQIIRAVAMRAIWAARVVRVVEVAGVVEVVGLVEVVGIVGIRRRVRMRSSPFTLLRTAHTYPTLPLPPKPLGYPFAPTCSNPTPPTTHTPTLPYPIHPYHTFLVSLYACMRSLDRMRGVVVRINGGAKVHLVVDEGL